MVRIAVCDDEEKSLNITAGMLEEYKKVPVSVDCYHSGEELLASEKVYDLILLDIDMDGMSGIETARNLRIRDKDVKLIYITNYSDYTIFAFAVHAFAYLLKPLDKEKFFEQMDEAVSYGIKRPEKELEWIAREGIVHCLPTEILYFEYLGREVVMHTEDKVCHLKKKINDVAEMMRNYDFVMPHKSFVVNLYRVESIHGYDITMTDGSVVPLSQKKSAEFRRSLNQYLAEQRGGNS